MNRFLLICLLVGAASGSASQGEALADYFFVDRVGRGRNAHVDVFVHTPDGKKEYIGSASTRDASESGLGGEGEQMSVLALSKDRRSLVFRHYPEFAKGRSKQEGGIYYYEYGKGARLLYKSAELVEFWMNWQRPLPKDVLVFQTRFKGPTNGPMMALTAEGKEFPLILLGGTPLHQAAYEGRTEEIDALLEKGEPINARTYWGDTPLAVALKRMNDETAVRLADRGADVDLGPTPALHLAARHWSIPTLEALGRRGVSMNTPDRGDTALLLVAGSASSGRKLDESSFFSGDDDGKRNWERQQALMLPMVEWLLKHGADANARNQQGETALHGMTSGWSDNFDLESVRLLLEHGADPNLADERGNTPLHRVVLTRRTCYSGEDEFTGLPAKWQQSRRYQVLSLLVPRMRDLNVRNTEGKTPLEMAVDNENYLSAQFLIDHGARSNLRGKKGETFSQLLEKQKKYWEAECGRNPQTGDESETQQLILSRLSTKLIRSR